MRSRRGMTLIETIIALLLMALAMIVMLRLTGVRLEETKDLGVQFDVRSADAFMYDIYQDFHVCNDLSVDRVEDSEGRYRTTLIFDLGSKGSRTYEYRSATRTAYIDGAKQFKCSSFVVRGTKQHLFVSIKLHGEKRLEYEIWP